MENDKEYLNDFLNLIKTLRSNCPWDKRQTIDTLKKHIKEESEEVIETDDMEKLEEELGDLFLVITMIAEVASENSFFNFFTIMDKIKKKIIFRHPHIFENISVNNHEDVKKIWNERKKMEKKNNIYSEAVKIQKKASNEGFDWDNYEQVIEKLYEEIEEFKNAETIDSKKDELGDILFVVLHLSNFFNIDPSESLMGTVDKFNYRFSYVKKMMKKNNYKMNKTNLEIMEKFWKDAQKKNEKK